MKKRTCQKLRNYFRIEEAKGWNRDRVYCLELQREFPKLTPAKALTLSIAKWQFICDWLTENKEVLYDDGGGDTCALCARACDLAGWDCCGKCLIGKTTGEDNCHGTPYHEFHISITHSTQLKYARAELAFLQSLRGNKQGVKP